MAQVIESAADVEQRRAEWVARVTALVDQVAGWAAAEGWAVERRTETIAEPRLGTYDAPALTLRPPNAGPMEEVMVEPVALEVFGPASGRVDVRAYPTFSRVSLLGHADGSWTIVTDSNVPLRLPWTRATFAQLAADLLA